VPKISTTQKFVIIVIALVVMAAVGWAVYKHFATSTPVDSYQACADAGNPIQLSYPSVCVTKDGRRFVNPDEHL
jgi:hypothetical protein